MINLQEACGLPLLFEPHDNSFHPAGEICFDCIDKVKLDNVRPVLLNKTLSYPRQVYTEYLDASLKSDQPVFKKNKLHYNIILMPSGLLGVEYLKTHIFAPDKDRNEITAVIDVILGRGIILIQKIKIKVELDFDTEVDYVCAYHVKRGDRVTIPQDYMYTFINIGEGAFIVGRLFEDDGKIDYRSIRNEQGMCYYVIRKNARKEIVKNPRYKKVPPLVKLVPQMSTNKFRLTSVKPIYIQCTADPQRFRKLLV